MQIRSSTTYVRGFPPKANTAFSLTLHTKVHFSLQQNIIIIAMVTINSCHGNNKFMPACMQDAAKGSGSMQDMPLWEVAAWSLHAFHMGVETAEL